jgi:hypothetical protein
VFADEPFELRRQLGVTADTKIGVDARLERFETPLLEPRSRILRERLVGEVGERRTTPQCQSRSEELRSALGRVGGERVTAFVHEPLEAKRIDALGVHLQGVSASRAHQHVLDQRPAEVRHIDLDRLDRGGGRALAPHEVGDAIDGEGLAAVQQQDREHRTLTRSSEFDRPIVVEDLQWTEDPELQHSPGLNADATGASTGLQPAPTAPKPRCWTVVGDPVARATGETRRALMRNRTNRRPLLATVATTALLAGTAPAALAMPIDVGGSSTTVPAEPERVKVVRVQVDEGLDWGDAGIGAAGMLALVLVGFGGAHMLSSVPSRRRTAAHS